MWPMNRAELAYLESSRQRTINWLIHRKGIAMYYAVSMRSFSMIIDYIYLCRVNTLYHFNHHI